MTLFHLIKAAKKPYKGDSDRKVLEKEHLSDDKNLKLILGYKAD